MKRAVNEKRYHELFRLSILIKGIDGILELIGASILFLVSSSMISRTVEYIFQHELLQDPNDFIANALIDASHNLSISSQHFAGLYLFIHGAIKVAIVAGLWKNKLWAYPMSGVVLGSLVIYQLFRLGYHFSVILLFLTSLDILILVLLRSEYQRLKHKSV